MQPHNGIRQQHDKPRMPKLERSTRAGTKEHGSRQFTVLRGLSILISQNNFHLHYCHSVGLN